MTTTDLLTAKLAELGVAGAVVGSRAGPVVTQYEVRLEPGVRVSAMRGLESDLAMALSARSIRIEAPIPGRDVIGIEVPNATRQTVRLDEVLTGPDEPLRFALGLGLDGSPLTVDLRSTPHLLVAGATGAGKSVMVNTLICSLLRLTPDDVRFVLIDLKGVELNTYTLLPHMMTTPIEDATGARMALQWAVDEMELRYRELANAGLRDIASFRKTGGNWPYIVVVVDELADLMMQDSGVERLLVRIAQKARAVGIHLVLATQRPSVDVITGLLKANIPSRIAFTVATGTDSRVILDDVGAENLTGKGDLLFATPSVPGLTRAQGVYVTDDEIEAIVRPWEEDESDKYVGGLDILLTAGGAYVPWR